MVAGDVANASAKVGCLWSARTNPAPMAEIMETAPRYALAQGADWLQLARERDKADIIPEELI